MSLLMEWTRLSLLQMCTVKESSPNEDVVRYTEPQNNVPAVDLHFEMLLGSTARINFPLSPPHCLGYLAIDLIKYVSRLQGLCRGPDRRSR